LIFDSEVEQQVVTLTPGEGHQDKLERKYPLVVYDGLNLDKALNPPSYTLSGFIPPIPPFPPLPPQPPEPLEPYTHQKGSVGDAGGDDVLEDGEVDMDMSD
jgi:hypothetical protein